MARLFLSSVDRPEPDDFNYLHIAFGVDKQFFVPIIVVIQSIIDCNPGHVFSFHIFTSYEDKSFDQQIRQLVEARPHRISLHLVRPEQFSDCVVTDAYSKAMYYRLLAPIQLARADRILYLDADVICLKEIAPLFALPLDDEHIAGVVVDIESEQHGINLGISAGAYFNSGVMLINTHAWLKNDITAKVLEVLACQGHHFRLPDQDALNLVLAGRVFYLPSRYNFIFRSQPGGRTYDYMPPPDAALLHYAGGDKPWQPWSCQKVDRFYQDVADRSPVANRHLQKPISPDELKRTYKSLRRKKRYGAYLYHYLLHACSRLRRRVFWIPGSPS